jgi:Tfp pilus assembly protein PilN
MINLLPADLKTNYRYARRNVGLRTWVAAFVVTLVGLGAITTYGLLTIQQSTLEYSQQITATEKAFEQAEFGNTRKQVKDISNTFKLVVKVLSQEVLFSQLLKQIAATIPPRASLTGLNIAQTQGAIDITAVAADYKTATQVQVNLSDPANKIFSKADIVSITCANTTEAAARYPCTVTVRALFAANNPFLLINSGATP